MQEVKMWIIIIVLIGVAFGSGYILHYVLTDESEEEGKITIIDDLGRTVNLDGPADRIVSLSASATETLYAIDAKDKLVGRDRYSDYPPEVLEDLPEDVGGVTNPSIEKIIGLDPDVILAWYFSENALASISDEIPCIFFFPDTISEVMDTILLVGLISDKLTEAENFVAEIESRINNVMAITDGLNSTQRPKVYAEMTSNLMSVGATNYLNEIITVAGGVNIAGDEPLKNPILSNEYIINKDPNVIVIAVMGSYGYDTIEEYVEALKDRPSWDEIDAVQNDRVYAHDNLPDIVGTNPRLVIGIELLAYWFHPSLFEEPELAGFMGLTSFSSVISVN